MNSNYNLIEMISKIKNNEKKMNDFFVSKGNSTINTNLSTKVLKIVTNQNRRKLGGILFLPQLTCYDYSLYVKYKLIQCSDVSVEIVSCKYQTIEKLNAKHIGDNTFEVKIDLPTVMKDNMINPLFMIFLRENNRNLPKKIFNVLDFELTKLDKEKKVSVKNEVYQNIDTCKNSSNDKDFEDNQSCPCDTKKESLDINPSQEIKGKVLIEDVNTPNHHIINNEEVEFKSKCPVNHVENIDKSIGHGHCKGNCDYFKLFPELPKLHLPIKNYVYYAENAVTDYVNNDELNRDIPLGYNIFGQFVVHDMTFNSLKLILAKPEQIINHESIKLDLHDLYGGPQDVFYFHDDKFIYNDSANDLPRNYLGKPIIPDPRNEENYLIGQMHLLFMRFHNKLVDYYKPTVKKNLFNFVKEQVLFHYQWLIVNDFLPRWVDNEIIEDLFTNYNFTYKPNETSGLPIEWAMVAARSGHMNFPSHIRIAYDLIISEKEIHVFTKGKLPKFHLDWSNLFSMTVKDYDINFCKKYDGKIISDLADMVHLKKPPDLPSKNNNLLLRNMLRNAQFDLASGQDYARRLGVKPIPEVLLKQYDHGRLLETSFMIKETPLFIYILKEAEIFKSGNQLTGVGGRLFAEPFLALLFNDSKSYLHTKEIWKPILGKENDFKFKDLISFVYS